MTDDRQLVIPEDLQDLYQSQSAWDEHRMVGFAQSHGIALPWANQAPDNCVRRYLIERLARSEAEADRLRAQATGDIFVKNDLALLVRRLVRRLQIANSPMDKKLAEDALSYLQRKDLQGSLLRDAGAQAIVPPDEAAPETIRQWRKLWAEAQVDSTKPWHLMQIVPGKVVKLIETLFAVWRKGRIAEEALWQRTLTECQNAADPHSSCSALMREWLDHTEASLVRDGKIDPP